MNELLQNYPNAILQVSAQDLKQFAEEILKGAQTLALVELEKMQAQDELLTIDEVSKIVGVTTMTLHRWDKNRVLCKVKIGGKVMYRKSDINKLMEGRK